jgi:hypothetical protein
MSQDAANSRHGCGDPDGPPPVTFDGVGVGSGLLESADAEVDRPAGPPWMVVRFTFRLPKPARIAASRIAVMVITRVLLQRVCG